MLSDGVSAWSHVGLVNTVTRMLVRLCQHSNSSQWPTGDLAAAGVLVTESDSIKAGGIQTLGPIPCQTFARLHKTHKTHEAHRLLDWVQSAQVYVGYEVHDGNR